ncbi:hypothetical protein BC938DRAFT_478154 [Jimgerdemannia flammicorona]|uniref:Uncharacterized protein n=1 Tax=Jimgerdemannia flammicorona TaxID=994334 RepID=A0A433QNA9_9FUNG|nr:hypothetical protein BC938DRAFT_478154 [Jimgerdemannia flammicorona]
MVSSTSFHRPSILHPLFFHPARSRPSPSGSQPTCLFEPMASRMIDIKRFCYISASVISRWGVEADRSRVSLNVRENPLCRIDLFHGRIHKVSELDTKWDISTMSFDESSKVSMASRERENILLCIMYRRNKHTLGFYKLIKISTCILAGRHNLKFESMGLLYQDIERESPEAR